jgi:hypothetical protein
MGPGESVVIRDLVCPYCGDPSWHPLMNISVKQAVTCDDPQCRREFWVKQDDDGFYVVPDTESLIDEP